MPLESGITSPGTAGDKLRYRRKNGIVFITGTFKVTGKAANTQRKICQPPIGFRSTYSGYYYLTNTATGHVVSRFIIGNDGSINLEWVKKNQMDLNLQELSTGWPLIFHILFNILSIFHMISVRLLKCLTPIMWKMDAMSAGAGYLETKGAICDRFSPLSEGGLSRADWR